MIQLVLVSNFEIVIRRQLWITGINLNIAIFVESHYVKRLVWLGIVFHTRRPDRHPNHRQTDDIWPFCQQAVDLPRRYMSFNYIAIHDGCMAGLDFKRYIVLVSQCGTLGIILDDHIEAVFTHVHAPAAAAASSRCPVDGDEG